MSKEKILEYFSDINYAYNDCTRLETLKNMLNELEDIDEMEKITHTNKFGVDKTVTTVIQNCGYRLPCGYCMMINKPCPMGWSNYDITCCADGVRKEQNDD